mgnify:CR=1 FL=1
MMADTPSEGIRLGLVGLGKIARDQHLPAIERTDGIELVAVASRGANHSGVANYHLLEEMLEAEDDLQAVVLCQPPQVRYAAARQALLAGKHVFLEKPPGMTLSEVEALNDIANSAGVTLFASWHSRAGSAVEKARAWLAGRTLEAIRIDWKEDVRVWHPGQEWIWQPGGFGVFDPGINALSILTHIVPEAVRMKAADLSFPENRQAPIAAALEMATASGAPVHAEFDFLQTGPQSWDIAVETSDGPLVLGEGGNTLFVCGEEVKLDEQNEYRMLYQHFVELVGGGRSDVDLAPLRLVADAFLCGNRRIVDPFHDET